MEQQHIADQRLNANSAWKYVGVQFIQALFLTLLWVGSITAFVLLGPDDSPAESQRWSVGEDVFQPLWLRLVLVVVKPLLQTIVFGPPRVQARATRTGCDKAMSWIKWVLRLAYLILFFVRVQGDFSNIRHACKGPATTADAMLASMMVLGRSSNLSSATSTFAIWEMVVGHVYWLELHKDGGSESLLANRVWYSRRLHEIQTWWRYRNNAISVHGYIFVVYGFLCLPYRLCGILLFLIFAVPAICVWPYIFLLAILGGRLYRRIFAFLLLRLAERRTPRAIPFVEHTGIASQTQVLIACHLWPLPLTTGMQCDLLTFIVDRLNAFRIKGYEGLGATTWYQMQARVFRATGATTKNWRSIFERLALYTVFLPFAIGSAARFYAGESYGMAIASTWRDEPSLEQYFQQRLRGLQRILDIVSLFF